MKQWCSTIPKLGLYTFDVGSDWLNGASLMNYTFHIGGDIGDSLLNYTIHVGNDTLNARTLINSTLGSDWLNQATLIIRGREDINSTGSLNSTLHPACLNENETVNDPIHFYWGVLTITMSWFPAVAGIFLLVGAIEWKWYQLLLVPIRFLLWPLLLPIAM